MIDAAQLKREVAERAAALVVDGMRIGLGSGTTAEAFVRSLEPRLSAGLRIEGVASSERTARLAIDVGLPLVELTASLDLAVDGADAIERGTLTAIKGLGGALTREKIIAHAARRFILIADDSKLVDRLSAVIPRVPIPVEVLSFGWRVTQEQLAFLGTPRLRERAGMPVITDNGNYILDLYVDQLSDPESLGHTLHGMTGVVEHGLFVNLATLAIVSSADGIAELIRDS